jgi:hypothetical protein
MEYESTLNMGPALPGVPTLSASSQTDLLSVRDHHDSHGHLHNLNRTQESPGTPFSSISAPVVNDP